MSRSTKKGPYVYHKLLKKVQQLEESGERKVIRVWQRASVIVPEFIGHNFEVHNGKKWFPVFITEELVGHRFGEFAPTRTFRSHSRDERKAVR
ncbi:30S ribosomal protein S19 [bacterium]|nr:30S ribosomal protein S19 [bacterium]